MTQVILLRSCNIPEASADNIVFPVSENVRTYANGDIRFLHLNTSGEPAGGASHVMVTCKSANDGLSFCAMLSLSELIGFSHVDLLMARSAYDPRNGLTVFIPVQIYDGQDFVERTLEVTVNQKTKSVEAEIYE